MAKATILAVDDDAAVSHAIVRDLRARYGSDYRIVRATSGGEALDAARGAGAASDRPLALVVSDQRMPGMTGIELLEQAREQSPDAKLLLLTAYADTDVAITAINDIGLDYYLLQAVGPARGAALPGRRRPARRLAWTSTPTTTPRSGWSATGGPSESHEVKMFLARNHVPYRWLDVEREPEAGGCVELAAAGPERAPAGAGARRRAAAGPRARSPSPRPSGCGPAPSSRSTTSASSAAARPGWRRPCTPPPRACAPSWSSVRRRAGRPARARRSRTTSASPRDCRAPTSPTGRSPRRPASGPRRCSPARSSGWSPAGRCARCCSRAAARSRPGPSSIATGVSYRRLEADGHRRRSAGRGVYYGADGQRGVTVRRRGRLRRRAPPTRPARRC